jgi:hypothetical protein
VEPQDALAAGAAVLVATQPEVGHLRAEEAAAGVVAPRDADQVAVSDGVGRACVEAVAVVEVDVAARRVELLVDVAGEHVVGERRLDERLRRALHVVRRRLVDVAGAGVGGGGEAFAASGVDGHGRPPRARARRVRHRGMDAAAVDAAVAAYERVVLHEEDAIGVGVDDAGAAVRDERVALGLLLHA